MYKALLSSVVVISLGYSFNSATSFFQILNESYRIDMITPCLQIIKILNSSINVVINSF